MSYAFLNSNGRTELGDIWETIGKGIEAIGKGKEVLGIGKGTTIPISQVIVEPPPYDPYAPKSFDIGSLLIPAVVVVGGGLLMFFLIKAMKKK